MGGPYWAGKDERAWSIPKGEYDSADDPEMAARREFSEEVGLEVPAGELLPLGSVRQGSGKVLTVWAIAGDADPDKAVSNSFDLEWPPRSGRLQAFPEIDCVAWVDGDQARRKLVSGQVPFVDRLFEHMSGRSERMRFR